MIILTLLSNCGKLLEIESIDICEVEAKKIICDNNLNLELFTISTVDSLEYNRLLYLFGYDFIDMDS